ncbi:class I SAM-dependent methyltransferase [Nostoc sp. CALU 1950]|uniref:class I SAM-dependent methyltransferase n=1 Tax=Nostoc sp. CALU 1950 TaxID=3104321 RepID=UPI003EBF13ED
MTPHRQITPDCLKRLFAWGMAKANTADNSAIKLQGCNSYETMAQLKQAFFADLDGRVLEIGPGAGANLSYYPTDIYWIGIEPNPFMHSYLKEEAERFGLHNIELRLGSAERLEIEDNSIDVVVSTHVLCSVTDLVTTLREIRRVLKPDGRFLFIEHVAAECGTWTRRIQDGIEPVWKTMFDNCHPNRETGEILENVGFESVDYQQFNLSFPIFSPHIAGVARKKIVEIVEQDSKSLINTQNI